MELGTIRNGAKIGKDKRCYYAWANCPDCGRTRWVQKHQYEKNPYGLCRDCYLVKLVQRITAFNKKRYLELTKKHIEVLRLAKEGLPLLIRRYYHFQY